MRKLFLLSLLCCLLVPNGILAEDSTRGEDTRCPDECCGENYDEEYCEEYCNEEYGIYDDDFIIGDRIYHWFVLPSGRRILKCRQIYYDAGYGIYFGPWEVAVYFNWYDFYPGYFTWCPTLHIYYYNHPYYVTYYHHVYHHVHHYIHISHSIYWKPWIHWRPWHFWKKHHWHKVWHPKHKIKHAYTPHNKHGKKFIAHKNNKHEKMYLKHGTTRYKKIQKVGTNQKSYILAKKTPVIKQGNGHVNHVSTLKKMPVQKKSTTIKKQPVTKINKTSLHKSTGYNKVTSQAHSTQKKHGSYHKINKSHKLPEKYHTPNFGTANKIHKMKQTENTVKFKHTNTMANRPAVRVPRRKSTLESYTFTDRKGKISRNKNNTVKLTTGRSSRKVKTFRREK